MTSVKQRQAIEKQIVASAIADLLEAGFELTVNDGAENVLFRSTDPGKIASVMMTTDEDYLVAFDPAKGERVGWVLFVYGNDGPDVISDYTMNLDKVLGPTTELAERLDEEMR